MKREEIHQMSHLRRDCRCQRDRHPRRPKGCKTHAVVEDRHEEGVEAANLKLVEKPVRASTLKPAGSKATPWLQAAHGGQPARAGHGRGDHSGQRERHEAPQNALGKGGDAKGTPVLAAKGYDSAENREILSQMKHKIRIMRKAQKNRPLTGHQAAVNKAVSRVQYVMDRTFGSMHRWFGAGLARYVGWRRRTSSNHGGHRIQPVPCPKDYLSKCIK